MRDWVLENLFSMEDHDALESYFDQTYTGSGPRPPARAEGDIASSSPDRVHIRLEEVRLPSCRFEISDRRVLIWECSTWQWAKY